MGDIHEPILNRFSTTRRTHRHHHHHHDARNTLNHLPVCLWDKARSSLEHECRRTLFRFGGRTFNHLSLYYQYSLRTIRGAGICVFCIHSLGGAADDRFRRGVIRFFFFFFLSWNEATLVTIERTRRGVIIRGEIVSSAKPDSAVNGNYFWKTDGRRILNVGLLCIAAVHITICVPCSVGTVFLSLSPCEVSLNSPVQFMGRHPLDRSQCEHFLCPTGDGTRCLGICTLGL